MDPGMVPTREGLRQFYRELVTIRSTAREAGEMVLLVEHLSCKHEDLNLIPRICQKKKKRPSTEVHPYNILIIPVPRGWRQAGTGA